jgi:hypothetical protein
MFDGVGIDLNVGNAISPPGSRETRCPNLRVLLDVVIRADQTVFQIHSHLRCGLLLDDE